MISLILDLRFSFYTCVLNLHKARHRYSLTQASTEFASKTTNWKYVHPSRTNLKLLPHCCPPFASSSTWPGATASQGFWGGEVAMTSNIFRPQLKRNHQSGLSNQIFVKKIGDKVQNALLTLWRISWVERTSKTIGKIGTGSKSFEALIKAFYLQTLELFPNGLIMEEQLHIFGSLLQASINIQQCNEDIGPFFTADIPCWNDLVPLNYLFENYAHSIKKGLLQGDNNTEVPSWLGSQIGKQVVVSRFPSTFCQTIFHPFTG